MTQLEKLTALDEKINRQFEAWISSHETDSNGLSADQLVEAHQQRLLTMQEIISYLGY